MSLEFLRPAAGFAIGRRTPIGYGMKAGTRAGSFVLVVLLSMALSACSAGGVSTSTPAGAPPTIAGTPSTSVAVGSAYSFLPVASSSGGGALTFSIENMPSWATFSKSTGLLSGTPGAADVNIYSNIIISVSNASATAALAAFSISVTQLNPVSGACGPANGVAVSSAPTSGLCSVGSASAVAGTGPWSWSCAGSAGGSTAQCSAPKNTGPVSGACGPANGVAVSSAPTSGLCSIGSASAVAGTGPWSWSCAGSAGGSTAQCSAPKNTGALGPVTNLHFTPNGNFDSNGNYLPGADGFNLADVSDLGTLNSLPTGVLGLVWVGLCNGVDANFTATIQPFVNNPKLFGFYLMDEPDPTGQYAPLCTAANLMAESDWIHANLPGAKTFIVMLDLGTPTSPNFAGTYNPANTDIDLFGLDPYPVRPEFTGGVDYSVITAGVNAAEAAGIPVTSIVPVYQVFGGGGYTSYALPTPTQEQQILSTWGAVVPNAVFDYAYSWGPQNGDQSLSTTLDLQPIFLQHNAK